MTILYIKTHNVTGLKYFGKTTQEDCFKYKGSGKHWARHIKKHGYDVQTEIYAKFDEDDFIEKILLQGCALLFSLENNIVESEEWANKKPENGLDGGLKGSTCSDETKAKMSETKLKMSSETKAKISKANKGKTLSDKHKAKISAAQQNMSYEQKAKISAAITGLTRSDETKAKMSESNKLRIGKIYIHNLSEKLCKMIKPGELPEFEKLGWIKGKFGFKN